MKKEMLINVSQPEECRVVIVEDGVLEELYIERTAHENYVGNIYKGRIVNMEPSIQAAFVDFGVGRNGFLHISDVEPQYYRQGGFDPEKSLGSSGPQRIEEVDLGDDEDARNEDANGGDANGGDANGGDANGGDANGGDANGDDANGGDANGGDANGGDANGGDANGGEKNRDNEAAGRPRSPRRGSARRVGARPRIKPPIQDILRRGDEVLVQVIKEGIGTKGPTLSTYISIPGRYLVLMPALGRVGVSRKIEDDDTRRRLRQILHELNPPKGLGFIVRTAGSDRTKKELSRDMAYLMRLWKVVVRRIKKYPAPIDIYEESDMIIRTIRDIFSSDVDAIYIDEKETYERAREFLQLVMPRHVNRLHLYEGKQPLFHKYGVEDEISRIHQREVRLKQGGSLVIDQTEALVAIDVNSGTFRTNEGAEESAYRLNMIASKEIARQLRLRDLGGVVVNDFIDMRKEKHRRDVERSLRDAVKRDRARTKILRTSPFGLIEMTRQRIRPSLKRSVFKDCPGCTGTGLVKTAESMSIEVIRMLMLASQNENVASVTVNVADDVATYLSNKKRRELARLEDENDLTVQVLAKDGAIAEYLQIECLDANGRAVKFEP